MEIDMGEHASILYGTHFPNRIFVGCLPAKVTAASLGQYFSHFGEVIEAKVVLDESKRSKRFGFVTFSTPASVTSVLDSGDFFMCGKHIVVGPAVKRMYQEQVPDEPVKIFVTEPVTPIKSSEENKESTSVYRPPKAQQVPHFIYRAIQQTPPVGPGNDNASISPPQQHYSIKEEPTEIESSSSMALPLLPPASTFPTYAPTYAPSIPPFPQPPCFPVYYGYYY